MPDKQGIRLPASRGHGHDGKRPEAEVRAKLESIETRMNRFLRKHQKVTLVTDWNKISLDSWR